MKANNGLARIRRIRMKGATKTRLHVCSRSKRELDIGMTSFTLEMKVEAKQTTRELIDTKASKVFRIRVQRRETTTKERRLLGMLLQI